MPVKRFVLFQRYGKVMECWGKLSLSTYRVYLTMYKIHVQRHKYMFGNKQDSIEHTYLKYTTIFHKKKELWRIWKIMLYVVLASINTTSKVLLSCRYVCNSTCIVCRTSIFLSLYDCTCQKFVCYVSIVYKQTVGANNW